MDVDKYILETLLRIAPELLFDSAFMARLLKGRQITAMERDFLVRAAGTLGNVGIDMANMRRKTLMERIVAVAPELLSTRTIDWMRSYNLIDVQTAHFLRIGLRGANKLLPSNLLNESLAARIAGILGTAVTRDLVDLWRLQDQARIDALREDLRAGKPRLSGPDARRIEMLERASVRAAAKARGAMDLSRIALATLRDAGNAKGVWAGITVVASNLLSDDLLKAAIRTGAIKAEHYNLIRALEALGYDVWKKGITSYNAEGWQARALLISEGFLSPLMVDTLVAAKIIPPELRGLMYPATTVIRAITRGELARYQPSRKARVIPGESPIKTFARSVQGTDRAIAGLLAEAAQDAEKAAEAAASLPGFGAKTRSAQQRLVQKQLIRQQQILWENIGHLTLFGQKQAAGAAQDATDFLTQKLFKATGEEAEEIRKRIEQQARAGVDSYISRSENVVPLSTRVYNNIQLSSGRVQRDIQKALLRGLSARELAKTVSGSIKPGVSGGTSYAAMRLARTEMNNAFHNTQIRYTREMPWVRGYKWNTSGSHPHPDICNTMATENHAGLGPGVYRKVNVPQKPHPQCLCYLTNVTDSNKEFERGYRAGKYNQYLNSTRSAFDDPASAPLPRAGVPEFAKTLADLLVRNAPVVVSALQTLVE